MRLSTAECTPWTFYVPLEMAGELPMLEEDVLVEMAVDAADGEGKPLFGPDRRLAFHTGDAPLAEEWMLQVSTTEWDGWPLSGMDCH